MAGRLAFLVFLLCCCCVVSKTAGTCFIMIWENLTTSQFTKSGPKDGQQPVGQKHIHDFLKILSLISRGLVLMEFTRKRFFLCRKTFLKRNQFQCPGAVQFFMLKIIPSNLYFSENKGKNKETGLWRADSNPMSSYVSYKKLSCPNL